MSKLPDDPYCGIDIGPEFVKRVEFHRDRIFEGKSRPVTMSCTPSPSCSLSQAAQDFAWKIYGHYYKPEKCSECGRVKDGGHPYYRMWP